MALMGRVRVDSQPRPVLQMSPPNNTFDSSVLSMQDAMGLVNNVTNNLSNGTYGSTLIMELMTLTSCLPYWGPHLEVYYNDQLNRVFVEFRRSASDDRLDFVSRKLLLFLIEMRAGNWQVNEPMSRYFKTDEYMAMCNSESPSSTSLPSPTLPVAPLLAPGETIKTSGKFPKPTKIPGKNYYKDEVVIRNSDSGKVMGIKGRRVHMIEELSETVISFQRVNPGAKERLVQVTGADEAHINYAKQLMGDTIRRNASPVPCRSDQLAELERPVGGSSSSVNSSASEESAPQGYPRSRLHHSLSTNDASIGDYKYTVMVGNNAVKITGADYTLVMKSKLALDKFFESEPQQQVDCGEFFTSYDESDYLPPVVEPIERVTKPEPEPVLVNQPQTSPIGLQPTTLIDAAETTKQLSPMTQGNEPKLRYSWSMLCKLSQSKLCQEAPNDWEQLCPIVLRKVFDKESALSVQPGVTSTKHATNTASLVRMTSLPAGIGDSKRENHIARRASQPLYTVNQAELNNRKVKPLFADIETEKNKRSLSTSLGSTQNDMANISQTNFEDGQSTRKNRSKPFFGDIETEIARRISNPLCVEGENDTVREATSFTASALTEVPKIQSVGRTLSLDTSHDKLIARAALLQISADMEFAEMSGAIPPNIENLPVHFQVPKNVTMCDDTESDFLEKMHALDDKRRPSDCISEEELARRYVLGYRPGTQHAFDSTSAHADFSETGQSKVPLGRSRSLPYHGVPHHSPGNPASPEEQMFESTQYKTTIPFRPRLTNSNIKAQSVSNSGSHYTAQTAGPVSPSIQHPSSAGNTHAAMSLGSPVSHVKGAYQSWLESQNAAVGHIRSGLELPLTPSQSPVDVAYHDSKSAAYQNLLNRQASPFDCVSAEYLASIPFPLESNASYVVGNPVGSGNYSQIPSPMIQTPSPDVLKESVAGTYPNYNPLTPSPEFGESQIETTISFRPKFAYSRSVTSPEIEPSLPVVAKEFVAKRPDIDNLNTSVLPEDNLMMSNSVGQAVATNVAVDSQISPVGLSALSPIPTLTPETLSPEISTESVSLGEVKSKLLKSFRPMITNPKLAFINYTQRQ